MIVRNPYLDTIIQWRDTQVIKVVTGVRRCGKSTLFDLYIDYLLENGVDESQIIYINLENLKYQHLLDYMELYNFIMNNLQSDCKNYIFIDEVQNCKEFERAVDSLFIQKNTDVYITGSNAYLLSGELATLLSGRYVTISMLPFSFKEYSSVHTDKTVEENFATFVQQGAFPYVTEIQHDELLWRNYIDGIYNTILVKDIAMREENTDIPLLESIVKILISSIGSPVSGLKIANTLQSSGRKISNTTVEKYLKALTDSYLFYKVDRYDVKGRNFLKTLGKYYMVDTGFRPLLVANSSQDFGHMIENIVYLELLRRGYKVSIGKVGEYEVDFVATLFDTVLYVQVAATVLDENTLERELRPLQKIDDNHPKIILTLDRIGANSNYAGIKQLNLIDWLLKS